MFYYFSVNLVPYEVYEMQKLSCNYKAYIYLTSYYPKPYTHYLLQYISRTMKGMERFLIFKFNEILKLMVQNPVKQLFRRLTWPEKCTITKL